MGSRAKKKPRTLPQQLGDEDRLSRLPDELIHKILSFVNAKEVVRTSILSRQWELICTMNLNMLCTSLNDFSKISLTSVDSKMIGRYREVFSYLLSQGLNVSWVVDRLSYIEHLRFSKPLISELHSIDCDIDDAKTKLQELQDRRVEKLSEIEKAFGTKDTNLVIGFIGDDLLANP